MKFTLSEEMIDSISKAITQYAFRSGPIEEMHANNKLSQKDMKKLNEYMANRIAGLLTVISNGYFDNVVKVLSFYTSLSSDWNKVKPDVEEFYLFNTLYS